MSLAGNVVRYGVLVVAVFASLASAAPASATHNQLLRRAAFDLQCDEKAIAVTEIDARTRGASGCGRQATYVENCDGPRDAEITKCSWVMNSPAEQRP